MSLYANLYYTTDYHHIVQHSALMQHFVSHRKDKARKIEIQKLRCTMYENVCNSNINTQSKFI